MDLKTNARTDLDIIMHQNNLCIVHECILILWDQLMRKIGFIIMIFNAFLPSGTMVLMLYCNHEFILYRYKFKLNKYTYIQFSYLIFIWIMNKTMNGFSILPSMPSKKSKCFCHIQCLLLRNK